MAKRSTKKNSRRERTSEPFRVLSIDGGGIRGIIPGMILAEVERRTKKPIAASFDLIAGTSTGGILALGLTIPDEDGKPRYSANDLVRLYHQNGERIFPRPLWRRLPAAGFVADVFDDRYPSEGIEGVLHEYFGDSRLKDSLVDVLIPSYAIERRVPFLFKTRHATNPDRTKTHDFAVRDVARATSAAPTYFEPAVIRAHRETREDQYALVDGGVYANNPSLCALAEAIHGYGKPIGDIRLVSLGTGQMNRPIRMREARGWGLAGWVRPVLSIMMDGMADTVEYQCAQLLKNEQYVRIDDSLTDVDDDMDNASERNLRDIGRFADRLLREREDELEKIVALIDEA